MEKPNFSQLTDSISEWLGEQTWFQQLKAKWDELDSQSRLYLKVAAGGISLFGIALVLLNFMWTVHTLKKEVADKSEVVTMIGQANDELKRLREINASIASAAGGGTPEPWPAYFETTANSAAGLGKANLSVSDSKTGTANDTSKELMFDIGLKKVNLRQLVRYAQGLENGPRPVKLRNLVIDTQPDGTGYLDATLSVSAFTLVANK